MILERSDFLKSIFERRELAGMIGKTRPPHNQELGADRMSGASFLSCVGEPLKRNIVAN